MYSLSSIRAGLAQPREIPIEVNRILEGGFKYDSHPSCNPSGINVPDSDWDNLIILDACRYDYFTRLADALPGKLEKRQSKASATRQFLQANFEGGTYNDIVYVTANPQLYRINNGIYDTEPLDIEFYKTIEVWQEGWDEEHRTVQPDTVTEAALGAADRYPNKRLLVHFIQPHGPYIGPTGVEELPTERLDLWNVVKSGDHEIDLETVKTAYKENLELVLPHMKTLLDDLLGKTIVTSDHGELLGDRDSPLPLRRYGHPSYTRHPKLINVPWLSHQNGNRKEIKEEETGSETVEVNGEIVEERLEDLGYMP